MASPKRAAVREDRRVPPLLLVSLVALVLVGGAWWLARNELAATKPPQFEDVRITAVEGRYDSSVRYAYFRVSFEPSRVQLPRIACQVAVPGGQDRDVSAGGFGIESPGVVSKGVALTGVAPGTYQATCNSGNSAVSATVTVPPR